MADYIWCHGPKCHTYSTQDRVRGTKGFKVLRTRKIKQDTDRAWYDPKHASNYFCSNGCQGEFWAEHVQQIIRIAPRNEPLETPIEDPTKNTDNHYYSSWNITKRGVDTDSNVG